MIEMIAAYLIVGFVLVAFTFGMATEYTSDGAAETKRLMKDTNVVLLAVTVATVLWFPIGVYVLCHALGAFIQRRINALKS